MSDYLDRTNDFDSFHLYNVLEHHLLKELPPSTVTKMCVDRKIEAIFKDPVWLAKETAIRSALTFETDSHLLKNLESSPKDFKTRVEQTVQSEWTERGHSDSSNLILLDLSSPHKIARLDPLIGSKQVRYQATFRNNINNTTFNVTFNYNLTTGIFGTIKPASGKKP